jgi:fatty acid desaturase
VRCDCGDMNYVEYGEIWQCPTCDRRWNTSQIPSEEYWGIMHEMRQFRVRAMTTALCIGGTFALLAVTVSFSFFLLLPIFMTFWYIYYMPRWRRHVRERARSLPEWTLRPE